MMIIIITIEAEIVLIGLDQGEEPSDVPSC